MRSRIIWFFLASAPTAHAQRAAVAPRPRESIVIHDVTVIDVEHGRRLRHRDVTVRDGVIRSVSATGRGRGDRLVDARGKYLIPGLWDMHVHLDVGGVATNVFFPLMLANGITGVREMASDCIRPMVCDGAMTIDTVRQWRRTISAGRLAGPRIFASSEMLDGPHPISPYGLPVADTRDARTAVQTFQKRGVDFLKIYSLLSRDAFLAIARDARAIHLPFAGHAPIDVTTLDATNAGMWTMEHGFGLQEGCSRQELSLRAAQRRTVDSAIAQRVRALSPEPIYVNQFARATASFDAARCKALYDAFRRNHTAQTPTLVLLRAWALADSPARIDSSRLRYIPPTMLSAWNRPLDGIEPDVADPSQVRGERLFWLEQRVQEMQKADVRILAGTDVGNPWIYPGFALHDELRLLVQSGLSPLEALRAATLNPARAMSLADSLGSVTAGKRADLVLLDADPLVDITNAARINAVIADGRLYDRATLDRLLARVAAGALQLGDTALLRIDRSR